MPRDEDAARAELDIYRQEMGLMLIELREFIRGLRENHFKDLSRSDIADAIEEIING